MNTEQIRNHLILEGWVPLRYDRVSGSVWQGVHKEGVGLVYFDISITSIRRASFASGWPFEYTQDALDNFVGKFKCRWADVEEHLQEIFEQVPK